MDQALMKQERKPLTAGEVLAQVRLIQEVMNAVMKEGKHYGKIPGTPKPTLYKAGAEKLLSTFHIGVDPEDRISDLSTADEIRYRVLVRGFWQGDGEPLGTGLGECSSNEEKYKWRKPVCDEEFNETASERKRIVWKKGDGANVYQQKQVRMNPIDVANTILKMAKKRALIDMTLTVTAASDIFDQDLEDLPDGMEIGANGKPPIQEPKKKTADAPKDKPKSETAIITVKDVRRQDKKKDGTPMKSPLYIITSDAGVDYKTFSESIAKIASKEKGTGIELHVEYKKDSFGNTILDDGLSYAQQPPEDENAQE